MDSLALIRRLHEHRCGVNRQLLDAAAMLDVDQLQQPFEIGQGSVWQTLMHLYGAEYVWLEALLGIEQAVLPGDRPRDLPGTQRGDGGVGSLSELRSEWESLKARWDEYLNDLTPERLDEPVYRVSTSSGHGRRIATSRADVLLHLALHAQYTTAQAVNMLKRLGILALPDVMLITLARNQHPENRISPL